MKERIDRHKDGSIKAKGHMKAGELEGYWEWFRRDGTKMRSGYFENGKQVGPLANLWTAVMWRSGFSIGRSGGLSARKM